MSQQTNTDLKCPYCSAAVKYPSRPRNQYAGDTYMGPTTYHCGTVTSTNWSPPVQDKNCRADVILADLFGAKS